MLRHWNSPVVFGFAPPPECRPARAEPDCTIPEAPGSIGQNRFVLYSGGPTCEAGGFERIDWCAVCLNEDANGATGHANMASLALGQAGTVSDCTLPNGCILYDTDGVASSNGGFARQVRCNTAGGSCTPGCNNATGVDIVGCICKVPD